MPQLIKISKTCSADKWYSQLKGVDLPVIAMPQRKSSKEVFDAEPFYVVRHQKENKEVLESDAILGKYENTIKKIFDETDLGTYFEVLDAKKTIHIKLKLASEDRKRNIGYVTKSTKTLHIRRKRSEHLHIKSNAYGFNEYIIKTAKLFDTIELVDEHQRWKFPVQFIRDVGAYLYFKEQGFEKQLFVSLQSLEKYKVNFNL